MTDSWALGASTSANRSPHDWLQITSFESSDFDIKSRESVIVLDPMNIDSMTYRWRRRSRLSSLEECCRVQDPVMPSLIRRERRTVLISHNQTRQTLISASLPMVSLGLISMGPRLPIMTIFPYLATTVKSFCKLTLASISRMTSGPLPSVNSVW